MPAQQGKSRKKRTAASALCMSAGAHVALAVDLGSKGVARARGAEAGAARLVIQPLALCAGVLCVLHSAGHWLLQACLDLRTQLSQFAGCSVLELPGI